MTAREHAQEAAAWLGGPGSTILPDKELSMAHALTAIALEMTREKYPEQKAGDLVTFHKERSFGGFSIPCTSCGSPGGAPCHEAPL